MLESLILYNIYTYACFEYLGCWTKNKIMFNQTHHLSYMLHIF